MPIREMPTIAAQRYGLRIKRMREDLNWSQQELAEQAGVTFYDVRALEWGYRVSDEIQFKIVVCLEEAAE